MAIFYDFLEVVGGAEKFTIELANSVKQPLVVGGVDNQLLNKLPTIEGELTVLGGLTRIPLLKSIKGMHQFKNIDPELTRAKVNLFSGSNAPLTVHRSLSQLNYYYCHTPPRFAYDLFDYYQSVLPGYQAAVVKVLSSYVRGQYCPAIKKMDKVFCNSVNVQKRLQKYIGVEAEVLYPPIDTRGYQNKSQNGYYLSTARLEDYKRVELIVRAFLEMPNKKLVVLSGGSLSDKLKRLACSASNITFTGWVSADQVRDYVANCIATIYLPIDEDFGMSPVESMAAGKAVIGVNEGGLKETVLHRQTGWLCKSNPSVNDIIEAVDYLSVNRANAMITGCFAQSEKFKPDVFYRRMKDVFNP